MEEGGRADRRQNVETLTGCVPQNAVRASAGSKAPARVRSLNAPAGDFVTKLVEEVRRVATDTTGRAVVSDR